MVRIDVPLRRRWNVGCSFAPALSALSPSVGSPTTCFSDVARSHISREPGPGSGMTKSSSFRTLAPKADLIAVLLLDLGCRNISVESTVGLTPQGNAVHFEPTPEVTEWLQKTW
jgi:hypothetical protein